MSADLTSLLFSALASPLGVSVACSDADRLRQQLYRIRRENPLDFASLSFILPPNSGGSTLWIVRKPDGAPQEP